MTGDHHCQKLSTAKRDPKTYRYDVARLLVALRSYVERRRWQKVTGSSESISAGERERERKFEFTDRSPLETKGTQAE
jgi:hypothetical protein